MAGSVFDSAIYARLFPAGDAGKLFTDTAELRAMLLVEGALAKVQGAQGIIPEISAQAIHRATMELQIDPAALAVPTGENGVSVPGLVAAFRAAMNAPEHGAYMHWGATSQDIIDTGLMLRLRQALSLIETRLGAVLETLARLADLHAALPMAARTYGQQATPTSFGAVAASWGWPLLDLLGALPALRSGALWVSLSGAAGTAAALGPQAAETRAQLAEALGLGDPGRSWHTDRGPVLRIAGWLAQVSAALAKIGEDVTVLARTELGEIRLAAAGASSTMPQKQNPVGAAALVALHRQVQGELVVLSSAAPHADQRDGAAWFTEWLALPHIVLGTAAAVERGQALLATLEPVPEAMARALTRSGGLIHAETLSFALAARMPRPEAQAVVKALCREAQTSGAPLAELVARDYPDLDVSALFDPAHTLGLAPQEARQFADTVKARG